MGTTNRKKVHTRTIVCEGFQREDGLWDIEAALLDTKSVVYSNHERGNVKPGEPIHTMMLRVTLDLDRVIQDIQASMPDTPFRICPQAVVVIKKLVGLQIQPGWMRKVKDIIANNEGCTHLMGLLGPISTTAYQTMYMAIEQRETTKHDRSPPPILNQCHALASHSEVVKELWPEFYKNDAAI